jgi:ArsR family transcriptional regulator, arsenate/arsenite/antimonite-responsive transcriptional repressor
MSKRSDAELTTRYADMFSAMGSEPRLQIVRLLLSAHPEGLVVGDIGNELEIPSSTLSHHLDKLKNEDLVRIRREGTFLWYSANTEALQELLGFLYAECCTRNKAIEPQKIVCCKSGGYLRCDKVQCSFSLHRKLPPHADGGRVPAGSGRRRF